jgi:hypothetical protein
MRAQATADAAAADTAVATTSEAEAEAGVGEFIDGWRAPASADAFADHFERVCADDVRMIQPQMPTLVGKRAFRERFVRPLFETIPDIHATVHDWAASGEVVFISFTLARRAYFDPTPILRAVATRPRAWPSFLRLRARQFLQSRQKGSA